MHDTKKQRRVCAFRKGFPTTKAKKDKGRISNNNEDKFPRKRLALKKLTKDDEDKAEEEDDTRRDFS